MLDCLTRRGVAGLVSHPDFSQTTLQHDIAVLTLKRRVRLGGRLGTVCLPGPGTLVQPGMSATITGWGTTSQQADSPSNRLRSVEVTILSNADCAGRNALYGGKISGGMVCAAQAGRDACKRDSGGPLVVAGPGGRAVLAGVVSWGQGCAGNDF